MSFGIISQLKAIKSEHVINAIKHVKMDTGIMVEALPLWSDELENPDNFSNLSLIKNIIRDGIRL